MLSMEILDFLGRTIYHLPDPPPRVRTEPMQVLAVGPPRSGTESLQQALIMLGYPTYHGWDIVFEDPLRTHQWAGLGKRKFRGAPDGDVHISAAEFDELLGHCTAVTDAAASCFAAELIAAYPDAKVILNTRRDLDAWHRSAIKTIVGLEEDWWLRVQTWFNAENFWAQHAYHRHLWQGLFRSSKRGAKAGIVPNGKWVYREHCNMIRGLVGPDNLLEWSVEDGWEPLCKFLGKEVPQERFPNTNSPSGYAATVEKILQSRKHIVYRNIALTIGTLVAVGASLWRLRRR